MGTRGRPGSGGVEALRNSIRLRFTWAGKRRYETERRPPTAANLIWAHGKMARINAEIKAGVFSYATHFPDSPTANGLCSASTFKLFAEEWLKILTVGSETKKQYTLALKNVWGPALDKKPLRQIRYTDIKLVMVTRHKLVSGKTVNNDLIPLRGVLDTAVADGLLTVSPAEQVKNLAHQAERPDPFTPDEVEAIIGHLRDHAPPEAWAYYEFAFMTGLRPSEQIIARWGKVDWRRNSLRVDTARVGGREKGTKTSTIRDVDLSPRALAALTRMKPFSLSRGLDEPIFCDPSTGRPWKDAEHQRVGYFHPALQALGIRRRKAYQTRHTYATTALMGGVKPAYIALQLGHANCAMVFKVYARWIDGAQNAREAAKLAALQGVAIGPELAPAPRSSHVGDRSTDLSL
jgi:integrase